MEDVRQKVREDYGTIAASRGAASSCCTPGRGCGSGDGATSSACQEPTPHAIGYSDEEISALPEGANLGLGCGNPHAIAALKSGQTVLDLGSGAGIDCFLAARQVGPTGTVIGVDMTADMIDRARENAKKDSASNVEFRLGEIEHLPVADGTVDVILSNCVINLSPDKPAVFREAFRVLKPGGRLAISDIVATAPLPQEMRDNIELHVGCVAGAAAIDDLARMLADAGFDDIRITPNDKSRSAIRDAAPGGTIDQYVVSAMIEANRR